MKLHSFLQLGDILSPASPIDAAAAYIMRLQRKISRDDIDTLF